MDNDKLNSRIAKITKVFVPVLIVAAVIGIWLIKNNENTAEDATRSFSLEAEAVDLAQWKAYGVPMIIVFGAEYCPACQEMVPVLGELNEAFQGKAVIKYVDIGENPGAEQDFPLQVIPTLFFFNGNGSPFVPEDAEAMQMTLYTARDTGAHTYTAHQGGMTQEQVREVLKEMGVQ